MKRYSICMLAVVVSLLMFTSCSGGTDNPLIGTWECDLQQNGMKGINILTFNEDGTLNLYVNSSLEKPFFRMEASTVCPYTFEDNTIIYTVDDSKTEYKQMELEGVSPDDMQRQIDFAKQKGQKREEVLTEVVIDGDVMTAMSQDATGRNKRITFTKVK